MSGKTPKPEDEILDAVMEEERASIMAQLRARGFSDDETSWLSLS